MIFVDLQVRLDAAVTAEQGGNDRRGRAGDAVDVPPSRTVSGAVSVFDDAVGGPRLRSAARPWKRSGKRAGVPEPEYVPTAAASSAPAPAAPDDATSRSTAVVAVVAVVDATAALGPAKLAEAPPELWWHQVVQDRIDGRVQVDHDPGRVQYDVVVLEAQVQERVFRDQYDPHGEHAEREQAHEERQDDGGQHEDHLSAGALIARAVRAAGAWVGHQVRRDHRV